MGDEPGSLGSGLCLCVLILRHSAWLLLWHSSPGMLGCLVIWCLPRRVGKERKKLDLR